jgi:hypothetical protein
MKKIQIALFTVLASVSVALAVGYMTTGWGSVINATDTVSLTSGFNVSSLSLYNSSTGDVVYALVNCTTNEFAARKVLGTTVPISAGQTFVFATGGGTSISSVCLEGAATTSVVYAAGM